MNANPMIERLVGTPAAIAGLVGHLPGADARFKPPTGAWSIVEIVCHLVDEERDDFRTRLRLTLESPQTEWPPIDPEGWARERKYEDRDFAAALAEFSHQRAESIGWLRSLEAPEWTSAHVHPKFGPIRAGDLLVSWAAHDALHVRQIAKRMFELATRDGAAGGFKTAYAGQWGA